MSDIRRILLHSLYESNLDAIKKQRDWQENQQNIFYGQGRPIFFQKIDYETKIKPYHLWYLNEDKYRSSYKPLQICKK